MNKLKQKKKNKKTKKTKKQKQKNISSKFTPKWWTSLYTIKIKQCIYHTIVFPFTCFSLQMSNE